MNKIRRINLYGGPGSGKSTAAAYLFSQLKLKCHKVELVREYAKDLVYEGKRFDGFTQLSIFAEQIRRENSVLESDKDVVIITDSPVALAAFYSRKYKFPNVPELLEIEHTFEKKYPSVNLFLKRNNKDYQTYGRNETYEEAKEIDLKILRFLCDEILPLSFPQENELDFDDYEGMMKIVEERVFC